MLRLDPDVQHPQVVFQLVDGEPTQACWQTPRAPSRRRLGALGHSAQRGIQTRFTIFPFLIVNSVNQDSARSSSWPGPILGRSIVRTTVGDSRWNLSTI